MNPYKSTLSDILRELTDVRSQAELTNAVEVAERLIARAQESGHAASGSWRGHHANVYFRDFKPIPRGKSYLYFKPKPIDRIAELVTVVPRERQYDLRASTSKDEDWVVYAPENTKEHIIGDIEGALLETHNVVAEECAKLFHANKDRVISLLRLAGRHYDDLFLEELGHEVKSLRIKSQADRIEAEQSSHENPRIKSNRVADNEERIPPHIEVYARAKWIHNSIATVMRLAKITETAIGHLEGLQVPLAESPLITEPYGQKIFIGHGSASAWKRLKSFLEDELELTVDEFNQSSSAGKLTFDRLQEMVDDAAIAFLVMTGDDELKCGKFHPRLNVVHEAGLFHCKLGNERAIILLEEGCEKFSNIDGITFIPFSKNKISETFNKIENTLRREGLLKPNS